MSDRNAAPQLSRRELLRMIGLTAGGAAMYQAMTALGFAKAAYELRNAGYSVQVLEYNARPGGRNWTLRGGDTYTELGGATQQCRFDEGLYVNPGPWRLPHHHEHVLHYCRELGVKVEPFIEANQNVYVHSASAFDGKPVRAREYNSDFNGTVAELLKVRARIPRSQATQSSRPHTSPRARSITAATTCRISDRNPTSASSRPS